MFEIIHQLAKKKCTLITRSLKRLKSSRYNFIVLTVLGFDTPPHVAFTHLSSSTTVDIMLIVSSLL